MIIYSYLIHHKYGTDILSSKSREGLDRLTANYCRQWWNDSCVDEITLPDNNEECIRTYFENSGTEYTDYFEIDTDNLQD